MLCSDKPDENCKPIHLNLFKFIIEFGRYFSGMSDIFIGFAHVLYTERAPHQAGWIYWERVSV